MLRSKCQGYTALPAAQPETGKTHAQGCLLMLQVVAAQLQYLLAVLSYQCWADAPTHAPMHPPTPTCSAVTAASPVVDSSAPSLLRSAATLARSAMGPPRSLTPNTAAARPACVHACGRQTQAQRGAAVTSCSKGAADPGERGAEGSSCMTGQRTGSSSQLGAVTWVGGQQ